MGRLTGGGGDGDDGEVGDDGVGAGCPEVLGVAGAVDTDDETEVTVVARGNPGGGVLDDGGAARVGTEASGGLQEQGGVGFAGQPEGFGVVSVDVNLEHPGQSGGG